MQSTTPLRADTPSRSPTARAWGAIVAHPVLAVVAIALLARLVMAIGAVLVTDTYTIPDETLYLELGRNIVHGIKPNEWYPGYGQSLYDSLETYSAPLVLLFRIFGPHRLVGALFAVAAGTAVAGLTTAMALRFVRPAFALLAGLIVALLPSQVLFSSVALREAHVWLGLTVVAFGAMLMLSTDWRRIAFGTLLAAVALLGLGYLRDQTMLAAAWALGLAVVVAPVRLWPIRAGAALAVVVLVPWLAGVGFGGELLVRGSAGELAKTRATLAVDANTAFGGATGSASAPPPPPSAPAPAPAAGGGTTQQQQQPANGTVSDTARDAANGDESIRAGVRHLPVGLVDVTLRPFPWSATVGLSLLMARVETIGWYVLYALAIVGILIAVRRRELRLGLQFPVLLMGMLLGIAALTQGNLGTAFRHREQMVWALALCAAAGLQWLVRESRWAPRRRRADSSTEPAVEPAGASDTPAPAPEGVLSR